MTNYMGDIAKLPNSSVGETEKAEEGEKKDSNGLTGLCLEIKRFV